jgi:hypothetical protein
MIDSIIYCLHGFCNFSHAQQGQLLPRSGAQTVGVGGMRISVDQMVDPIDVQKWITQFGALCSRRPPCWRSLPSRPVRFARSLYEVISPFITPSRTRPDRSQAASATPEFRLYRRATCQQRSCQGSSGGYGLVHIRRCVQAVASRQSSVAWRKYAFEKPNPPRSSGRG